MLIQSNFWKNDNTLECYEPRRSDCFVPERIVLTRGCTQHLDLIDRICSLYSNAEIICKTNISHMQVSFDDRSLLDRHRAGKKTLVFGELKSAVRFSEERNNTCPNYWHFSPYGFCPYGCHYCYLAGTIGVKFSPAVKIFLNLPEMLRKIDRIASGLGRPVAFYLGKLQDGLALDPLTGFSRIMIPFFARHPFARLILLTKSADVQNLLDLDHAGHTILSWSLNPTAIRAQFEENTPTVEDRIEAMVHCLAAGYAVRAVLMPLIPIDDWQTVYADFLTRLLTRVKLDRLTLGGICSYSTARSLMNEKMSHDNVINRHMADQSPDGRVRYLPQIRRELYDHLIRCARRIQPNLPIALCLEESDVWQSVDLADNLGRCNCVL